MFQICRVCKIYIFIQILVFQGLNSSILRELTLNSSKMCHFCAIFVQYKCNNKFFKSLGFSKTVRFCSKQAYREKNRHFRAEIPHFRRNLNPNARFFDCREKSRNFRSRISDFPMNNGMNVRLGYSISGEYTLFSSSYFKKIQFQDYIKRNFGIFQKFGSVQIFCQQEIQLFSDFRIFRYFQ